jgi:CheY-like chemotaxis protein
MDIRVVLVDDTHLSLAVTDTGMGIPAEDLPRLFNPFDRLGRESSGIEGTGIGLTLSKRLTTLMGGRLDVESTPGHGSTFTVTMPLTDPPETQIPPQRDHMGAVPAEITVHSTVLSIQDNPSNVDLLTGVLRRRPGWSMLHAGNGRLGLELAATREPTVILLDLHLPDINGIDVLEALRADPKTSDVPVAILSADATPTQLQRLITAGAQTYLTKPIDVRELLTFLDTHTPLTRTTPATPAIGG